MPLKRFIHEEMFTSEDFTTLGPWERLLWIGLFGKVADDEGRGKATPGYLKSEVFPMDQVTPETVAGWLAVLASKGMIRIYEDAEGRMIFDIPSWKRWQRPKWVVASKFPKFNRQAVPGHSRENPATGRVGLGRVGLGREGKGRGGLGRESEGNPGGESNPPTEPAELPSTPHEPQRTAPATQVSETENSDSNPVLEQRDRKRQETYTAGVAALRKGGVHPAVAERLLAEKRDPES